MDTGGDLSQDDVPHLSMTDVAQTNSPGNENSTMAASPTTKDAELPSHSTPSASISASDVSMADDSDEGNNRPVGPSQSVHVTVVESNLPISRKRKSFDDGSASSREGADDTSSGQLKKVKLDDDSRKSIASKLSNGDGSQDRSVLPAEVWHHIFTFCPPRTLGNLLLVNKLFRSYLDPSFTRHVAVSSGGGPPPSKSIHVLKPNAIWRASRRLFWPHMPNPLKDKMELDMWRLACSFRCQECGKVDLHPPQNIIDPLQNGPGPDGVCTIWPFATLSCGPCLAKTSKKEIDLLLSSSIPSALMPALPFALSTPDLRIIPSSVLERGQLPANTPLTKLFWSAHVENLKEEFTSVKELSPAVAEEWIKGLDGRGIERRHDSARWEKYAGSGGVIQMRTLLYPGYQPKHTSQFVPSTGSASLSSRDSFSSTGQATEHQNAPPKASIPVSGVLGGGRAMPQLRVERTKEEATELKAFRRAEIERRAMMLVPPLPAGVLAHVPSFQAAIQITSLLDDNAWDLLKPRLLAQRGEAEQREKESIAQTQIKQESDEVRKPDDVNKDKEIMDKDWDDIQAPLRARIIGFADEIIRDGWDQGSKVTKETCPKFAADVLLYVRKRFYAEVAKDAAAARAAGQEPLSDPPLGPYTQKLTLDNMKWIFETKVKPLVEKYRKEIFLCNACDVNGRFYAFEGVVQHYAAKHTGAFSSGPQVVNWRAEWPEVPPFSPDPRTVKNAFYPPPGYAPPLPTNAGQPSQYGYNNPYPQGPPPMPQQPPQLYHSGPPPAFGAPPYADAYPPAQTPYPPAGYPPTQQSYAPHHPYVPPSTPYQPYPPPPPIPSGPYSAAVAGPPNGYGAPTPGPPIVQNSGLPPPAETPYNYNFNAYNSNGQAGYQMPPGGSHPGHYRMQFEDMVRNARELWSSTGGIKDLPGSVRVYTIIHHLSSRFGNKFSESMPLTMFIDGLSNNKDMRPVRNVNGLICRACHLGLGNAASIEEERKSFSLPQLVNHFQSKHIDAAVTTGPYGPPLDWTTDMVLLPETSSLLSLRSIVGSDRMKNYLISDALPQVFEDPSQPVNAYHQQGEPTWQNQQEYHPGPEVSIDNHDRFYGPPQMSEPQQRPQITHQGHMETYDPYQAAQPNNVAEMAYPVPFEDARGHSAAIASTVQPNGYEESAGSALKPDGNSRKLSHGFHSQQDQNAQQSRHGNAKKKSGSKGRNGHNSNKRRSGSNDGDRPNESKAARAKRNEVDEAEAKRAEEEQRRQEDEIRAMWAADRAQTGGQTGGGPSVSRPEPTKPSQPAPPKSTNPNRSSGRASKPNTPLQRTQPKSPRRHARVPEPDEPSILDALEMQLDQERSVPYVSAQPPPPPSQVMYTHSRQDMPPPHESERYSSYMDRRGEVDRRRSQSPVYVRYAQQPPMEQYREPSPRSRQREPSFATRSAQPPPMEEVQYERVPRQEYYRVYADEVRPRPVEYEAYELVEVHDPHGNYFIKRPVRRELAQEPARYYAYEDERPVRREVDPYRSGYEQVEYTREATREPMYRQVSRGEPTPMSRSDPAYLEEYDPRYPAAPPSAGRQIRYE